MDPARQPDPWDQPHPLHLQDLTRLAHQSHPLDQLRHSHLPDLPDPLRRSHPRDLLHLPDQRDRWVPSTLEAR